MVLALVLAAAAAVSPVRGVPPPADADVVKGIEQLAGGDAAGAVLTLDTAARRLARAAPDSADLVHAYACLAIARVVQGNDRAGRAAFRQALGVAETIGLETAGVPPHALAVFDAARAELAHERTSGPSVSKAGIIVGAVGGVAVAGAVIAAGSQTPSTTLGGIVESFDGTLPANTFRNFTFTAGATGSMDATLTWTDPDATLAMVLYIDQTGSQLATSRPTSTTSCTITLPISPQTYRITLSHQGGCGASGTCSPSFDLRVVHP